LSITSPVWVIAVLAFLVDHPAINVAHLSIAGSPGRRIPSGRRQKEIAMSAPGLPRDTPIPMKKTIVICLDGTSNQIGVSRPTNVGKTFEMVSLTDPARQVAYYDPGVGTLPSSTARGKVARLASLGAELAFGWGITTNVIQAYTWLMQHYQFRDDVYVFGFSRGAYTARALVSLLNRPGLLRPGSDNLVEYAVHEYANSKKDTTKRVDGIREFADAFCWGTPVNPVWPDWHTAGDPATIHSVPIKYLGIWDTVEATGLGPFGRLHWNYTRQLNNVESIRHAVAIDENRRPYREFLVDERDPANVVNLLEQVWFAGVHSDVGGTFEESELARIALKWVVDGAVRDLILRQDDSYSRICTMAAADAYGELHKSDKIWYLAGVHHRKIPSGATIHDTVRRRMDQPGSTYRPTLQNPEYTPSGEWLDLVPANELQVAPPPPF
jgi:uncharacterized protein (DUF2235 family)